MHAPKSSTVLRPCSEGSLRYRNESYMYNETDFVEYSARVEVCVNGTYVALCDSGFSEAAAEVACRARNYQRPFFRKLNKN